MDAVAVAEGRTRALAHARVKCLIAAVYCVGMNVISRRPAESDLRSERDGITLIKPPWPPPLARTSVRVLVAPFRSWDGSATRQFVLESLLGHVHNRRIYCGAYFYGAVKRLSFLMKSDMQASAEPPEMLICCDI